MPNGTPRRRVASVWLDLSNRIRKAQSLSQSNKIRDRSGCREANKRLPARPIHGKEQPHRDRYGPENAIEAIAIRPILDPSNPSVTLQTMASAAGAPGKQLRIELA